MKTPLLLLLSLLTLSSCAHRDGSQLQSALPGTQMRSGDIQLDLRTDKPRYRAGEKVSITLKSDQRCRVKLYSLDAQGQRTEIWPRPGDRATTLAAGQTLTLPPANATWDLKASEPRGTNTLVAEAHTLPKAARPATPASTSSSPYFQLHGGGWKGMTVEPKKKPAPEHAFQQKRSGEVRWLYEVK